MLVSIHAIVSVIVALVVSLCPSTCKRGSDHFIGQLKSESRSDEARDRWKLFTADGEPGDVCTRAEVTLRQASGGVSETLVAHSFGFEDGGGGGPNPQERSEAWVVVSYVAKPIGGTAYGHLAGVQHAVLVTDEGRVIALSGGWFDHNEQGGRVGIWFHVPGGLAGGDLGADLRVEFEAAIAVSDYDVWIDADVEIVLE